MAQDWIGELVYTICNECVVDLLSNYDFIFMITINDV